MAEAAGRDVPRSGPVADEVTRLLQAAQEWLRGTVGGHADAGEPCRACPLCRLVAALSGEPSDLADRVGAAAGAFVDAVRVLFDPAQPDRPADPPPADAGGGRVEPIEIS